MLVRCVHAGAALGTGAGRVCGASMSFQINAVERLGVSGLPARELRASSVCRAGLRCCRTRERLWGRLQECPLARRVEQKEGHALLPARNSPSGGRRVGPCVLPLRRAVTRSRQGARRRTRELARARNTALFASCIGTDIPGPRACFGLRFELAVAWRPSYCNTPAFALLLCCTPASDCCLLCSKMHHPLQLRSNPAQSSVGLWPPGACYMSTSTLATNRQRIAMPWHTKAQVLHGWMSWCADGQDAQ